MLLKPIIGEYIEETSKSWLHALSNLKTFKMLSLGHMMFGFEKAISYHIMTYNKII